MIDFEEFTRPWHLTLWSPPTDPAWLPPHGFEPGLPLGVWARVMQPATGFPACDLTWKNGAGEECSIKNLPYRDGALHAADLVVSFGTRDIRAEVTLWIERGVLKGRLAVPGKSQRGGDEEGNVGTFAADTNPPGPDPRRRG